MAMPSCSFPIQTIGSRHLAQGTVALHHAGQLFVRMNVIDACQDQRHERRDAPNDCWNYLAAMVLVKCRIEGKITTQVPWVREVSQCHLFNPGRC